MPFTESLVKQQISYAGRLPLLEEMLTGDGWITTPTRQRLFSADFPAGVAARQAAVFTGQLLFAQPCRPLLDRRQAGG
jgi:hypothetical protein